jgi:hypothetical protein
MHYFGRKAFPRALEASMNGTRRQKKENVFLK